MTSMDDQLERIICGMIGAERDRRKIPTARAMAQIIEEVPSGHSYRPIALDREAAREYEARAEQWTGIAKRAVSEGGVTWTKERATDIGHLLDTELLVDWEELVELLRRKATGRSEARMDELEGAKNRVQVEFAHELDLLVLAEDRSRMPVREHSVRMKLFISWSGKHSGQAATALRDWLPFVLPWTQPWIASEDIRKGAAWYAELADGLQESVFGIICVDPSNIDAPWVLFEAGALANAISGGRVAPLLFGVNPSSISGPLAQFQMTTFERADMRRLITSIVEKTKGTPHVRGVEAAFDQHWPALEAAIRRIRFPNASVSSSKKQRSTGRISSQQREVLRLIAERRNDRDPGPEAFEVAEECSISITQADHLLEQLRQRGVVRLDGGRWYLTEAGTAYVAKSALD